MGRKRPGARDPRKRAAVGESNELSAWPLDQGPVTPGGRTVIATGPRASTYEIAAYDASTGQTRWTRAAPVTGMFPAGLVIDPRSSAAHIGGYRLAAHSVATRKLLWIASNFPHGSIFGRDGMAHGCSELAGTAAASSSSRTRVDRRACWSASGIPGSPGPGRRTGSARSPRQAPR